MSAFYEDAVAFIGNRAIGHESMARLPKNQTGNLLNKDIYAINEQSASVWFWVAVYRKWFSPCGENIRTPFYNHMITNIMPTKKTGLSAFPKYCGYFCIDRNNRTPYPARHETQSC